MTLRIGTRRSKLALAQANEIASALRADGVRSEVIPMTTSGDRGADPSTDPAGLKGLFVDEIVRALRDGGVDLAVHSAKDLPAEETEGLVIAAVPERASPLDVLVTRDGELARGARVGTSSLRRRAQVFRRRPDVLVQDLRGNVDTRLRKLDDGEVEAIVLAAAGLLRLGVVPKHATPISVAEMVPAPGQGCLAVQTRAGDAEVLEAVAPLDHAPSHAALDAERALMSRLGGGCALPLGAFAEPVPSGMRMTAIVLTPDGGREARAEVEAATAAEAAELAALDLLAGGAEEILSAVRP
ncbi:MAG: hydroxymethylbilane synthase [Actinobacteria bacterium]|nr:hydroxymethylbilane synthase [Actinomycetota bacterium]